MNVMLPAIIGGAIAAFFGIIFAVRERHAHRAQQHTEAPQQHQMELPRVRRAQ